MTKFFKTILRSLIVLFIGINNDSIGVDGEKSTYLAKIFRQGKGQIDIGGLENKGWPEGFSFKKEGPYKVNRLSPKLIDTVPHRSKKHILESWKPTRFTSLSGLKEGEVLSSFRFIVHGLELKQLVEGIEDGSFDDFVHTLNDKVPLGDDFIPYYPYFLHKKTIISASLITDTLTATFGDAGFILSVPEHNYLCGAKKDIHTPTDIDFYRPSIEISHPLKSFASFGEESLFGNIQRYPLPTLEGFLTQSRETNIHDDQEITDDEVKAHVRMLGFTDVPPQLMQQIKALAKKTWQGTKPVVEGMIGKSADKVSIYTEIALTPEIPIGKSRKSTVLITGVFLRTSEADLETYLQRSYVQKLLKISKAFDLTVLLINDGKKYGTNL